MHRAPRLVSPSCLDDGGVSNHKTTRIFSLWKYSRLITEKLKERPKEGNHFLWQLLHLTIQSRRAEAFVRSAGREAVIAWKQPQMQGSLQLLPHR